MTPEHDCTCGYSLPCPTHGMNDISPNKSEKRAYLDARAALMRSVVDNLAPHTPSPEQTRRLVVAIDVFADLLQRPHVPSTLRQTLELDGPEPAPIRIAGFLRQYAMIIRRNERWDVPETMAGAYESAALVLEKYHRDLGERVRTLIAEWDREADVCQLERNTRGLTDPNSEYCHNRLVAMQEIRKCARELESLSLFSLPGERSEKQS